MPSFAHLEKFILNFSSWSFEIRVNRLHPCFLMVFYYYLFIVFYFSNYYFHVTFDLNVILHVIKITENVVTEFLQSPAIIEFVLITKKKTIWEVRNQVLVDVDILLFLPFTQWETGWLYFVFNGCYLLLSPAPPPASNPLSFSFHFIEIFVFGWSLKSSWSQSFTFIQRANFSLAPGKSPACRRANPAAPHTPEGSSPHLVETSMARDRRSASINRSRRRLQQINKNNDQISTTLSKHILHKKNPWHVTWRNKGSRPPPSFILEHPNLWHLLTLPW